MSSRLWLYIIILSVFTPYQLAFAAWSSDPAVNTQVCVATDDQWGPQLVSDGSGGAIVVWEDFRVGAWDIYAQRLDSSGNAQWTTDGVAVCKATDDQYNPILISDGSGGAIIIWEDFRNGTDYDIYAQRLDSSGSPLWTKDGVPICTASYDQFTPVPISDGSGGAIVLWEDFRNGTDYDIYAQSLDSSGNPLWALDGVAVCTTSFDQCNPRLISDGSTGAFIIWQDSRNGTDYDIYAQSLDSSGYPLWTTNGAPVSTAAYDQYNPQLISDDSGGVIIIWQDGRSGVDSDIYAQRLDSSGNALWATDGVPVTQANDYQLYPQLISDGSGGAIITWEDFRSGTASDIYAQRLDSSGNALWTTDGVPVSQANDYQYYVQLISDNSGGAIIIWQDSRNGTDSDIYIQRLDSSGNALWTTDGVALSPASDTQWLIRPVSDGSGGAIIAWQDYRSGTSYDIYAQSPDFSSFPTNDGGNGNNDGNTDSGNEGTSATLTAQSLIVPWYNDSGGSLLLSSFTTVSNPSPQTITVTVVYSGSKGVDATPTANTFIIGPGESKSGRPYQVSGMGEGMESGPPYSIPNATSAGAFGSAIFKTLMPTGYKLCGDTLRTGLISLNSDGFPFFFSGISPAFNR